MKFQSQEEKEDVRAPKDPPATPLIHKLTKNIHIDHLLSAIGAKHKSFLYFFL